MGLADVAYPFIFFQFFPISRFFTFLLNYQSKRNLKKKTATHPHPHFKTTPWPNPHVSLCLSLSLTHTHIKMLGDLNLLLLFAFFFPQFLFSQIQYIEKTKHCSPYSLSRRNCTLFQIYPYMDLDTNFIVIIFR